MTEYTCWERIDAPDRKDIIGVRTLKDGSREFLMHNEALDAPYYLASDGHRNATPATTASHYESTSAAKEDAVAFAAAERPEQTAHTPLPWKVGISSDGFVSIGGPQMVEMKTQPTSFNPTIADVWHEENARFIVTACNNYEALKQSHDALVEALAFIQAGCQLYGAADRARALADAALANAKALTEGL